MKGLRRLRVMAALAILACDISATPSGLRAVTEAPIQAQDTAKSAQVDDFLSQIAEERYLANTDFGFQAIEELQRAHCMVNRRCSARQRECVALVIQLSQELFGAPPSAARVKGLCQRVSTRYETPGVYRQLSRMLDDVKQAAVALNVTFPDGIRIGSLAVRSVNASAHPKDRADVQLIILDMAYFDFASDLTKAVARAVPIVTEGENWAVNREPAALARNLEADVTALRLVSHAFDRRATAQDAHMFDASAPFSVEYYFTLRHIMARAARKWALPTVPHADVSSEVNAFDRIKPCLDRPACDLTDFIAKETPDLSALQRHPSHELRRRIARHVLRLEEYERKDTDMTRLAVLFRESAEQMWQRLEAP